MLGTCRIIKEAFLGGDCKDEEDSVHNYARVLCHYASLILEFIDAWREGDGERVVRCWKLFFPHFQAANRTKYSIEAMRLQFQCSATSSEQLAHTLCGIASLTPEGE